MAFVERLQEAGEPIGRHFLRTYKEADPRVPGVKKDVAGGAGYS
jgi:hypothetical protein